MLQMTHNLQLSKVKTEGNFMQLTREFYIPKDAVLTLDDKENDVSIYRYERNGQLFGLGFVGLHGASFPCGCVVLPVYDA